MLKIGIFSKLSRISIRMLRYYDDAGLLSPKRVDPFTGYRYYGEDQLPDAERINALRQMGFGIAAIARTQGRADDREQLLLLLKAKEAELCREAGEAAERLRLLRTAMSHLRKDETMTQYNVTLKELPERAVVSVRKKIPSYDCEQQLWDILMRETAPLKLEPGEPCLTLAIFHDGEYKESDVEVEVQKTVKGSYPDTENVRFKTVPAVRIASATYQGGYEQITEVNKAVAAWVQENGYEFDGLSFCIYHVSPYDTSDPGQYVTEVCYPVRRG